MRGRAIAAGVAAARLLPAAVALAGCAWQGGAAPRGSVAAGR